MGEDPNVGTLGFTLAGVATDAAIDILAGIVFVGAGGVVDAAAVVTLACAVAGVGVVTFTPCEKVSL